MKKGFTLFETLIALAIVGIVAILVMPSFLRKMYNNTYVSVLQSTVSQLADGLREATAIQHINDLGYLLESPEEDYNREDVFLSTYVSTSSCGDTPGDCFAGSYKNINGDILEDYTAGYNDYAVLGTGASVGLILPVPNGEFSDDGEVLVDVNGSKGPNTVGRDVFKFVLMGNSAMGVFEDIPDDDDEVIESCKSASDNGYMCYYYLSQNDWRMDY